MLRQANGGVGGEGEAGHRQAVDVGRFQSGSLRQCVQCPADPPMGAVHRVAPVRDADRSAENDAVVAPAFHVGRRFRARVSCAVAASAATRVRSSPRWIFWVEVSGRFGDEGDEAGGFVVGQTVDAPGGDVAGKRSDGSAFVTMHAKTSSPRTGSGTGAMATAVTDGCWRRALSTSTAAMFSPERRMTFLRRSTKCNDPSGPRRTTSPVWNQPPAQASAVASGSLRYSRKKPRRGSGRRGEPAVRLVRRRCRPRATMRVSMVAGGAAEAVGADVARFLVGGDDGAGAGFGHRPGFDQREAETLLERRVQLAVDAGAESRNGPCGRGRAPRRVGHQDRRHDAEVVDDGCAVNPGPFATRTVGGSGRAG